MEQNFMKEKPILGLVLSMSLPMVISMLVNSLYNIVDSLFVAQISENAMTALSLVFPIQNIVNSIAVGFAIGINAVIAYHLGAQEEKTANEAASLGLFLSVLHGVILNVGSIAIMPTFLKMFTSDTETIDLGLRYSNIVFNFSIIIMIAVCFEKSFQAVGKMTVSMISMLSGCIANIILDPILIFGLGPAPKLGMEGAAIATGAGQVLTLIVYLAFYFIQPIPVQIRFHYLSFNKELILKLYSIGIPATLNMALPSLLISSLNSILAGYSQIYVLVLGAYNKLQTFLYLTANGIIQGIRPLIGYNYGAGEQKRVQQIYRTSLSLAIGIMAFGTLLCQLLPAQLIGLFTTNSSTIEAGTIALRIISIGFIVSSISVTSCGALEGLGMGMPSLLISLSRYVIVIIPAAFLLSHAMGAEGVWHAFWITELITGIIAYVVYRRVTSHTAAA